MIERLAEDAILTLADSLPDTVFLVDKAGKIRYANARCADSLGLSQAAIIGQTMIELVAPHDRDRTLREAGTVMAGNRRTGFENRYQHRDGSDVHFSWSARWLETHQPALRRGARRHRLAAAHLRPPDSRRLAECIEPCEQQVLMLLLTAASENQIAGRLGLTASTTQAHVAWVFTKLGVRGRMGPMSLCLRGMEA